MQRTLCCFIVTSQQFGRAQETTVDCPINGIPLLAPRWLEHVIDNFVAIAGMTDAQPQAPEIGRAELGLDVLEAVVTPVAAALLEADAARRQIEFIVNDENFTKIIEGNYENKEVSA